MISVQECVQPFVCALIGIHDRDLGSTIHMWMGKPIRLMAVRPTSQNMVMHILQSHYVFVLMKVANQERPHPLDLFLSGWDVKGGILVLAISYAPKELNAHTMP